MSEQLAITAEPHTGQPDPGIQEVKYIDPADTSLRDDTGIINAEVISDSDAHFGVEPPQPEQNTGSFGYDASNNYGKSNNESTNWGYVEPESKGGFTGTAAVDAVTNAQNRMAANRRYQRDLRERRTNVNQATSDTPEAIRTPEELSAGYNRIAQSIMAENTGQQFDLMKSEFANTSLREQKYLTKMLYDRKVANPTDEVTVPTLAELRDALEKDTAFAKDVPADSTPEALIKQYKEQQEVILEVRDPLFWELIATHTKGDVTKEQVNTKLRQLGYSFATVQELNALVKEAKAHNLDSLPPLAQYRDIDAAAPKTSETGYKAPRNLTFEQIKYEYAQRQMVRLLFGAVALRKNVSS